ncbi:VanZ family protein [uncultured Actinomyces sp.]|uniref:VanZ family protein n=1 Tax=uncultured Actinomyces sp. TaxID=249061 RepID=UPI002607148E|nr:VanZ family protein [uncultured Actinomyces sp.]
MRIRPRHAHDTPEINYWWVAVFAVTFTALCWILYTPATANTSGLLTNLLSRIDELIPALNISETSGADKILHSSAFATVTAAALLTGWRQNIVIGLSAMHAGLSELIQAYFIPGRTGDILDIAADVAGILIAWLIVALLVKKEKTNE